MDNESQPILSEEFVFIVGAPRSGTTWLQAMIGAHPRVCTTVELTLFTDYIPAWLEIWNKEQRNIEEDRWHKGLPVLWRERHLYDFIEKFLEQAYSALLDTHPQATHILSKNPAYALHVETIHRFLPQARFIHIVRDGRDVTASMIAASKRIGFGPSTVYKASRMWKRHVLAARIAHRYKGQYLELRYRDLLNDGQETLQAVFDFCNLPTKSREAAKILTEHQFEKMKEQRATPAKGIQAPKGAYRKGKVGSWQEDLSAGQQYRFHRIAGDLLVDLGYAKEEDWWAASLLHKVLLPPFAILPLIQTRSRAYIKNKLL